MLYKCATQLKLNRNTAARPPKKELPKKEAVLELINDFFYILKFI